MLAESPNVRRYGFDLFGGQLRAAHSGHGAAVLLGNGNALGDGLGESFPTAVAPQPLFLSQVRAKRCSAPGCAVAGGTRGPADIAMIDTIAERDHLVRGSGRHGESGVPGIGIRSLGRIGSVACEFSCRRGEARTRSELRLRRLRSNSTDIGDAIDAAFHVVGDVQRAV